jgi:hypothetical protein
MPPRERVRKSFCKMIYEIASYNFITLRFIHFLSLSLSSFSTVVVVVVDYI